MTKATTSTRAVRIKACELAASMASIEGNTNASRLMSLCVFFETYIMTGADQTESSMHLLRGRRVKNLKLITGGALMGKP